MKYVVAGITICLVFILGGCDYHELNEFDIVAGMAIDYSEEGYKITLELVDEDGDLSVEAGSTIAYLTGRTLPQAINSSEARFSRLFHFGNMQAIIISEEIAREEGFHDMLDFFIRDGDIRETIQLFISRGEAGAILEGEGADMPIVSYALEDIISPPDSTYAHAKEISIYTAFDTLKTPGKTLILPAVQVQEIEDKVYAEVNGLAVFSEDKLKFFLSEEHVNPYLYTIGQVHNYEMVFLDEKSQEYMTIYVKEAKTKRTFRQEKAAIIFKFEIALKGELSQTLSGVDPTEEERRLELEKSIANQLEIDLEEMFILCRENGNIDIANMGYDIYLWDKQLWDQVQENWEVEKQNIVIEMDIKTEIMNSGNIRQT